MTVNFNPFNGSNQLIDEARGVFDQIGEASRRPGFRSVGNLKESSRAVVETYIKTLSELKKAVSAQERLMANNRAVLAAAPEGAVETSTVDKFDQAIQEARQIKGTLGDRTTGLINRGYQLLGTTLSREISVTEKCKNYLWTSGGLLWKAAMVTAGLYATSALFNYVINPLLIGVPGMAYSKGCGLLGNNTNICFPK